MATGRPFQRTLTLQQLAPIVDSVAAHLGAKLGTFLSDERTLTDELCDMLCIWSQMASSLHLTIPAYAALPPDPFVLKIEKTTPPEEARIGADLEIILGTPKGSKRALLQAKVVDPGPGLMRGTRSADWSRLLGQLRAMREEVGDLGFLLLYVPADELDQSNYGYWTWEQGSSAGGKAKRPARFGACALAIEQLLTPTRRWRRDGFRYAPDWLTARPSSLGRVFLELLVCQRGSWNGEKGSMTPTADNAPRAYRSLRVDALQVSAEEWDDLSARARSVLDELGDERGLGTAI